MLAGTPLEATDGPVQFTVIVTDAIGTQASATLTLDVIATERPDHHDTLPAAGGGWA